MLQDVSLSNFLPCATFSGLNCCVVLLCCIQQKKIIKKNNKKKRLSIFVAEGSGFLELRQTRDTAGVSAHALISFTATPEWRCKVHPSGVIQGVKIGSLLLHIYSFRLFSQYHDFNLISLQLQLLVNLQFYSQSLLLTVKQKRDHVSHNGHGVTAYGAHQRTPVYCLTHCCSFPSESHGSLWRKELKVRKGLCGERE